MTNPFPGLPLIESPLFPISKASQGLTAEEERIGMSLHECGYAVFDFPDSDLDARFERIKQNLAPRYGVDLDDLQSDKTVGERRIQDAHSDSVHFSSLPERFMCGVWLAMEDIGPEAGPLFYIPGSHRWPIVTNALIGRRGYGSELGSAQDPYGAAWNALRAAYGAQEEIFHARKGQALIWCANLLHGGSQQTDPRLTRWSQVTHYYFEECIYYTPAFSDEVMGRLQLRTLSSIGDGRPRPHRYLGEEVADALGSETARRGWTRFRRMKTFFRL